MAIRKGTKELVKDAAEKLKQDRLKMAEARRSFLTQEIPEIKAKQVEEPKAPDLKQLEKDLAPIINQLKNKKMPGRKK